MEGPQDGPVWRRGQDKGFNFSQVGFVGWTGDMHLEMNCGGKRGERRQKDTERGWKRESQTLMRTDSG